MKPHNQPTCAPQCIARGRACHVILSSVVACRLRATAACGRVRASRLSWVKRKCECRMVITAELAYILRSEDLFNLLTLIVVTVPPSPSTTDASVHGSETSHSR